MLGAVVHESWRPERPYGVVRDPFAANGQRRGLREALHVAGGGGRRGSSPGRRQLKIGKG